MLPSERTEISWKALRIRAARWVAMATVTSVSVMASTRTVSTSRVAMVESTTACT
jgi:hypothetical protein